MRVLVSGGGTGGHITPLLATVDALRQLNPDAKILYVGQKRGLEEKIAIGAGIAFRGISAGKFRRVQNPSVRVPVSLPGMILNIQDLFRVARGIIQSLAIVWKFKPNVVLAYGGYVGLPVGIAASILHKPLVIHEADIAPGLTNRILAKRARVIAVGFPVDKYTSLPRARLVFTGNPIRAELVRAHRLEGVAFFGLEESLPTILVTGGSAGGGSLVDAVVQALPELTQKYQIIHLTGEAHIEEVRFKVSRMHLEHGNRYHPYSFLLKEMGPAMAAADVVVSRAGATTIAELAALRKPTILVPNAMFAGHQMINAQALARVGAVRVIPEDKISTNSLMHELAAILEDQTIREQLEAGIATFAVVDADQRLAQLILAQARMHNSKPAEQEGSEDE